MPMPKSVTRVKTRNKNVSVEFVDSCDQTQYFIHELCRAALRDVGKFLKSEFRTGFYKHFKRQTGNAGKVTYAKVIANKYTTAPRLEIGLPHSKRGKNVAGFYAYFQEFGTSTGIPKLGLLQNAAKNNVAKIYEIESKYLSNLSGDATRLQGLVSEKEYEDED